MMPKDNNSSGFIYVIPLLVLAIFVLALSMADFSKVKSSLSTNQSVLSESDDNNEAQNKKEESNDDDKVETKEEGDDNDAEDLKDTDDDEKDDQNEIEDDKDEQEFESESEIEIEDSTNEAKLSKFKLKIKTKTVNGKTIVETLKGEMEVENSPEDVLESLIEDGTLDEQESIEVKTNERNKVEYEIQGTESKKFLGIFNVVIPKLLTVSSETGEVLTTNQNVWSRILSLLSI